MLIQAWLKSSTHFKYFPVSQRTKTRPQYSKVQKQVTGCLFVNTQCSGQDWQEETTPLEKLVLLYCSVIPAYVGVKYTELTCSSIEMFI